MAGLALCVTAGLLVHTQLADTAVTDIAGDALYAAAAYLAVMVVAPRLPVRWVALIAAAWCVGVELFQLTGLPSLWGAALPVVTLVLGTVFDLRDLLVYVGAIAVSAGVDASVSPRPRVG